MDMSSWLGRKEDFSYPGWEQDYNLAQEAFHNVSKNDDDDDDDEDSPPITSNTEFLNAVHRLHEKQRVHDGDRSHPRLMALDQLCLSYPGSQDDIRNAEEAHFDNYYNVDIEKDIYFQSKLEGLQNRQQLYYGYSSRDRDDAASQVSGVTSTLSHDEIVGMLGACVICGERSKTHLFDPCGHLCACQSCANQVMRTTTASSSSCPLCRVPATKTIRVFFT